MNMATLITEKSRTRPVYHILISSHQQADRTPVCGHHLALWPSPYTLPTGYHQPTTRPRPYGVDVQLGDVFM